jgi:hypothetical protein
LACLNRSIQSGDVSYKLAYKEIALAFLPAAPTGETSVISKKCFDDDTNTTVAKLVMEGILEIESGGEFVSGPAAQHILYKKKYCSKSG